MPVTEPRGWIHEAFMTLPWENRGTLCGLLWGGQITLGIYTTVVGTICLASSSFMFEDCRDQWCQPSLLLPWRLLQYAVGQET